VFRNYFKIAYRNLWKNKVFSFINILGLSAGLACCLLIFMFIQHDLNYERLNAHAQKIYRVTSVLTTANGNMELTVTPPLWAPLMKKDFPEIRQYTRLLKDELSQNRLLLHFNFNSIVSFIVISRRCKRNVVGSHDVKLCATERSCFCCRFSIRV